jgi:hypothetical protein
LRLGGAQILASAIIALFTISTAWEFAARRAFKMF